jgi:hypothetical protein
MLDKVEFLEVQLASSLHTALNGVGVQVTALNTTSNAAIGCNIVAQFNHLNAV